MKRYITYKRKKVNDNYFQDPNTGNRVEIETNGVTKFTETPYEVNGIFLAYVEYPDTTIPEDIEYFKNLEPAFEFTFITEEEANTMLANLGEVSVKDFIFIDDRPILELI